MARESKTQKKKIERVMHAFKHGDLESGSGGKVADRKQAIAIALDEAGVSSQQTSPAQADQGGRSATAERSKAKLYHEAKKRDIPGRSRMTKDELRRALDH